jgi:hypothetical protein
LQSTGDEHADKNVDSTCEKWIAMSQRSSIASGADGVHGISDTIVLVSIGGAV